MSRLDAHADVLKMKTKKGITKNKMQSLGSEKGVN